MHMQYELLKNYRVKISFPNRFCYFILEVHDEKPLARKTIDFI